MTREDAIELMHQYADKLEGAKDDPLAHVAGMPRRFPSEGSEKKAMRWLGFVRGVLFAAGTFSLEDLKEHSRTRKVEW
mgnify:CR=1 FL=1